MCFGRPPQRNLNPAWCASFARTEKFCVEPDRGYLSRKRLSASRFLHLSSMNRHPSPSRRSALEAGTHLLAFRRHQTSNLRNLAQDIGYPDCDPFQAIDPKIKMSRVVSPARSFPARRDLAIYRIAAAGVRGRADVSLRSLREAKRRSNPYAGPRRSSGLPSLRSPMTDHARYSPPE